MSCGSQLGGRRGWSGRGKARASGGATRAASYLYLALALLPQLPMFVVLYYWGVMSTLNGSMFEMLEFQYQEPVGKKHQVSDPKETTRYDYIISWLKCFKGCPGSESKSLTHPLRLWHHLAAHGSDFPVNHSSSLHPTPGILFSLCLKAGFCLPACLPAAQPTLNRNRGGR